MPGRTALRTRLGSALVVIGAILTVAAFAGVPSALADGDPASDVLVNFRVFNPEDLSSPAELAEISQLNATLDASDRAGFQIRVALIDSPTDLGTVTQLWDNPGGYAKYLWTELSNLYGGQILVVMPDGFGLYGPPHGRYAVGSGEAGVKALKPGPGTKLVAAALSAVPLLARAAGHPFSVATVHVATPAAAGSGMPATAWLALALGAILIAGCWWASLKARPLRITG